MSTETTGSRAGGDGTLVVVAILLLLTAAVLAFRLMTPPAAAADHTPAPLPPMLVGGWLNADASIDRESMEGKVVVIDFWATWCPPCVAELPNLADVYDRFREEDDFLMLGLSVDGASGEPVDPEKLQAFIDKRAGFDWPVAYGAEPVAELMGGYPLPTFIVFGRDGYSVWRGHETAGLPQIIQRELDRPN